MDGKNPNGDSDNEYENRDCVNEQRKHNLETGSEEGSDVDVTRRLPVSVSVDAVDGFDKETSPIVEIHTEKLSSANGSPLIAEPNGVVNAAFSEKTDDTPKCNSLNGNCNVTPHTAHLTTILEDEDISKGQNGHTEFNSEAKKTGIRHFLDSQSSDRRSQNSFDEDVPTYLPVRSRRGLEFGSEKLITDAVSRSI